MMRVIKVGGAAQDDPRLPQALAAACARSVGAVCIVHGGGGTVSALQRAMGAEPAFIGGRRVTTAADVELVRMALSGAANKQLVARLISAGVNAVGISGEDGALIGARVAAAALLGRVGAPETVNAELLRHLMSGGYVPVISPVARETGHAEGAPLNVNGDDAAAIIAAAVGAAELLFVSDVDGVVVRGARVAELAAADAMRAIADGTASGGMVAKLEAASRALTGGVRRVRIGGIGSLLNDAEGTLVTRALAAA
jgi:acetylglutamate kinase